jgi:hypothetical protein
MLAKASRTHLLQGEAVIFGMHKFSLDEGMRLWQKDGRTS